MITSEERNRRMAFCRQRAGRAWTYPETSSKEMDSELAEAFADLLLEPMYAPKLGCASTQELLTELQARLDDVGWAADRLQQLSDQLPKKALEYKTVPDDGPL